MENKKLTLENIDELGLDLLKQENRNSNELDFIGIIQKNYLQKV